MLVDVGLEAFVVPLILPVSDGVAYVIKERASTEVKITDKHAAEVTDVCDVVAVGA